MKLISMTDFVLSDKIKTQIEMIRYAKFLKQTLNLEMFIGDKAFFKGFKRLNEYVITNNKGDGFLVSKMHELTIESCIYLDLTLTQHAIKQLGL